MYPSWRYVKYSNVVVIIAEIVSNISLDICSSDQIFGAVRETFKCGPSFGLE
jgi:hypothetical protein